MGVMGVPLDIVSFAVMVMGIGFAIEYVVHIAHAFMHCEGRGLERTRNALEEMGLTVFSAFLSTATQQSMLIMFANSKVFEDYPLYMLLVIVKSGLSGFLFVPAMLGLMDECRCRYFGGQPKTAGSPVTPVEPVKASAEEIEKAA